MHVELFSFFVLPTHEVFLGEETKVTRFSAR